LQDLANAIIAAPIPGVEANLLNGDIQIWAGGTAVSGFTLGDDNVAIPDGWLYIGPNHTGGLLGDLSVTPDTFSGLHIIPETTRGKKEMWRCDNTEPKHQRTCYGFDEDHQEVAQDCVPGDATLGTDPFPPPPPSP